MRRECKQRRKIPYSKYAKTIRAIAIVLRAAGGQSAVVEKTRVADIAVPNPRMAALVCDKSPA